MHFIASLTERPYNKTRAADEESVFMPIFIGFDATIYDNNIPLIPKGKDGMSKRSIKKWMSE